MPNISYRIMYDGYEYGTWPGISVRENGKVMKKGQMYLGRVVSKEKSIFFTKERGYFQFDVSDQSFHPIEKKEIEIQLYEENIFGHQISSFRFGGSYFLGRMIPGIEYDHVLKILEPDNPDRLMALIHYYLLTDTADMHIQHWYQHNYASYLYPNANLYSQRVSEFYAKIGHDDALRVRFLEKHIAYVLASTDDDCCIIVDSTGCQNACDVPITRVSRHENDINIEFRVIIVVQRSTGLPLYYEVIPGNIVDISTIDRIKLMMESLGLKVTDILGDAGYACPAGLERLILAGSDFMMRLNPTYTMYKNVVNEYLNDLTEGKRGKTILYRNRYVRVFKTETVIGKDKETGEEKKGFLYLCQDVEAHHLKASHLYGANKKKKSPLSAAVLEETCRKLGVFVIVTTRDLKEEDVLVAYYMRQAIEQIIDFAKNYGRMMPVRNQNINTIRGHILISFITTFLTTLIKNRMNLMDTPYCTVPVDLRQYVSENQETVTIKTENSEQIVLVQEPLNDVFVSSPGALFSELELVNAIYFPENKGIGRKELLIPDTPQKEAREFATAFGLLFPEKIEIGEGSKLLLYYNRAANETCSRALAFTLPASMEEEEIKKAKKKQEEEKKKATEKQKTKDTAEPVVKKRGRPPGSKNRKTLEKLAAQGEGNPTEQKRGRGRPKGSKNKKKQVEVEE